MRIAGTFLLLGGLLLCISIVWAAVGFLMMGFGLICLLIAERRKKRPKAPTGAPSDAADRRREPPPLQIETHAQSAELVEASDASPSRTISQQAPSSFPEPRQPEPRKPARILRREPPDRQRNEPDTVPYDLEKWRGLLASDADISRSVETLRPFGKKYVDQLAMAYLAFEEKSYLPIIVKLVANAIKKDSGRDSESVTAMESDPNTDLISFAMSKARTSVGEQVFASLALNDGFAEKAAVVSKAQPENKPDARVKLAAVQSESKTPRSLPEGGAGSMKEQPDARGADQRPAVGVAAPARKAAVSVDDARDLTDLLNRIA
jgi:hypothetical protein